MGATAFGVAAWAWLLVEVRRGTSTVIIDFAGTTNPLSRAWRLLLPDLRVLAAIDMIRFVAWLVVLATLATVAWRHAGARPGPGQAVARDGDGRLGQGALEPTEL